MSRQNSAFLVGAMVLTGAPLVIMILKSTFLVDDFGQAYLDVVPYWKHVEGWLGLWGYRPISLLALPALIHLIGETWLPYAALNAALFTFSAWIYFFKVSPFEKTQIKVAAVLVCAMPSISSTVLFSPVNQFPATLSLAFAAAGHWLLLSRGKKVNTWLLTTAGAALFTLSLLSYEISLPLIAWTSARLFFDRRLNSEKLHLRDYARIFLPAASAVMFALFWQKIAAPLLFASLNSRARGLSIFAFATFPFSLVVSLPAQLLRVLTTYPVLVASVAAFCSLWLLLLRHQRPNFTGWRSLGNKSSAWLALGVCSLLFLISGAVSDLTGYLNRGLTSTWFILVILLFIYLEESRLKLWAILVVATILASNYVWWCEKVSEDIYASSLRNQVADQLVQRVRSLPASTVVVADLPCLLPESSSDVEIFCTSWDLHGALQMRLQKSTPALTLWDPGYKSALGELEGNKSYLLVRFSDKGKLVGETLLSKPPSQALGFKGRRSGGKNFSMRDCANFTYRHPVQSEIDLLTQCLLNPY